MADADAVVDEYLDSLAATVLRPAPDEWGVALEGLDVGLRIHAGLVRAQALALPPGALEAAAVLRRNRRGALVRYAWTASGETWVEGELPVSAVSLYELDRLLGLLVQAALEIRQAAGWSPR